MDTHYFNFVFFKLDSKWRWMADLAKEESAKEVASVMQGTGASLRTYSTLGIRDDADFVFWFCSKDVESIQNAVSKLYRTVFGKYLIPSRSYLSCTRPSQYAKAAPSAFVQGEESKQYIIVYPFTKTREWYLLPMQERQRMMDEHIVIGRKYPDVVLNTTYSFGIHDQDFMLAFECDEIKDFQNLIMELRQSRMSRYVKSDTPMILGIKKDIIPLIASLG